MLQDALQQTKIMRASHHGRRSRRDSDVLHAEGAPYLICRRVLSKGFQGLI